MIFPVSRRPDNHFLEAICCFPMVYFMAGTIDKYVLFKTYSFDKLTIDCVTIDRVHLSVFYILMFQYNNTCVMNKMQYKP